MSVLSVAEVEEEAILQPNLRAYNRWIVDFCSDSAGRLVPIAQLSLGDVEAAEAELRRAAADGVKGVWVPPFNTSKLPLGDPAHDRIFAACQELGLPLGIHPVFEPKWCAPGRFGDYTSAKYGFFHNVTAGDAVRHAFTSLFQYGVFGKFPGLRVVVLESGAGWIGYWLDRMDTMYDTIQGAPVRKLLPEKPSHYFRTPVLDLRRPRRALAGGRDPDGGRGSLLLGVRLPASRSSAGLHPGGRAHRRGPSGDRARGLPRAQRARRLRARVMEYVALEAAIALPGLRLVLTPAVPGPWGEAAKAILKVKKIAYTPVRQPPEGEKALLIEWTGQSAAPVAMYEEERPRAGWAEILFLAERLAPTPRLVPEDPAERALMLGLCFEICGEQGLGWSRRIGMLPRDGDLGTMAFRYGAEEADAHAGAASRVNEILTLLAGQLRSQEARGRDVLVGETLTAAGPLLGRLLQHVRAAPAGGESDAGLAPAGLRRVEQARDRPPRRDPHRSSQSGLPRRDRAAPGLLIPTRPGSTPTRGRSM